MAFFKRELGPVARFKAALKAKQSERQKTADCLHLAEVELAEEREAAERLAFAGASNFKLERAEAKLRAGEDRTKMLGAALAELDEQIISVERALADAAAQRDREASADKIETLAVAIEHAVPRFAAGAAALLDAVSGSASSIPEASSFSANMDAVRREVLSAADLVCWQLRTLAVRTRAGNANIALLPPPQSDRPQAPEIERQLIYTLNPLLWREGSEVRKVPAFVLVELPKALVPVALRHQHADYLSARRVQTLMHVHGNAGARSDTAINEALLIDLDTLAVEESTNDRVEADVA